MAQPQQGTRLPPTVASKVNEAMDSQKPINTQVDQIIQVFPRIQASRKVPISKSATSSFHQLSKELQKPFKQLEPFLAMHFEHVYFWWYHTEAIYGNPMPLSKYAFYWQLFANHIGNPIPSGTWAIFWHCMACKDKGNFMAVHNVIS